MATDDAVLRARGPCLRKEPQGTALEKRVCVGVITGAHGVRGAVRIKTFTAEPADVAGYGPLEDESGERRFKLRLTGAPRACDRAIPASRTATGPRRCAACGSMCPIPRCRRQAKTNSTTPT